MTTTAAEAKLIDVADLGDSGVAAVQTEHHGTLAVGISQGRPFAVSNRCRHLFASLGDGEVADDGCLQCPWHGARYDVATGRMTRGPQGIFRPVGGAIRQTSGRIALETYAVELRDGAIWIVA